MGKTCIAKDFFESNHFTTFASNHIMKKIIETSNAPAPIGPYSQAVQVGNLLYVSGQIAIIPATGELLLTNIEEETHQVMKNIGAILTAANTDYSKIIKTSIFLKDMNEFAKVNAVYGSYFTSDFPARETVQVSALPKFVNVEITVIATV
jgi:2-iminobutanoate/2-iminopropanoate deaminase